MFAFILCRIVSYLQQIFNVYVCCKKGHAVTVWSQQTIQVYYCIRRLCGAKRPFKYVILYGYCIEPTDHTNMLFYTVTVWSQQTIQICYFIRLLYGANRSYKYIILYGYCVELTDHTTVLFYTVTA